MGADAVGFVFAPSHPADRRAAGRTTSPGGCPRDPHRRRVPRRASRSGSSRPCTAPGSKAPSCTATRPRPGGRGRASSPLGDQGVRRRLARRSRAPTSSAPTSSWSTPRTPGSGKVFDWSLVDDVPDGPRDHPRRRPAPRQRRRRRATRCSPWGVDVSSRRRAVARAQGPAEGEGLHRAAPAPPRPRRTSGPTSCPTTGPTSEPTTRQSPGHRRRLCEDRRHVADG